MHSELSFVSLPQACGIWLVVFFCLHLQGPSLVLAKRQQNNRYLLLPQETMAKSSIIQPQFCSYYTQNLFLRDRKQTDSGSVIKKNTWYF